MQRTRNEGSQPRSASIYQEKIDYTCSLPTPAFTTEAPLPATVSSLSSKIFLSCSTSCNPTNDQANDVLGSIRTVTNVAAQAQPPSTTRRLYNANGICRIPTTANPPKPCYMYSTKQALGPARAEHAAPKATVRFSPEARYLVIPRKTEIEQHMAWYSQEETTDLQKQAKKAVKRRRRSLSEIDLHNKYRESTRGLEQYLSKDFFHKLRQEQDDVIANILLLQDHWRSVALPFDPKEVAFASYSLSAGARERARLQGAIDASAAHAITGSLRGLSNRRRASLS